MTDLAGLPWYERNPRSFWRFFLAVAFRLSPWRRVLFAASALALALGWLGFLLHLLGAGPFSLAAALRGADVPAPRRDRPLLPARARAARQALAEGRPRGGPADPVRPPALRALPEGRDLDLHRDAPGQHRGRRLLRRHRAGRGAPRDRGGRRGGQGHAGGPPHGPPPGQPPHARLRGPARRGSRGQAQRPPLREHPLEPADHPLLRRAGRGHGPARLRERRPQPAVPASRRASRRRGSPPTRWRSGSRRRPPSRR